MSIYNSREVSNPSYDEHEIDKQAKQQLVIDTIKDHISATCRHQIFRQIHTALTNGSSLTCEILSGGSEGCRCGANAGEIKRKE